MLPLDRAQAHARWAERYDAQGETQRSMAHFGRAVHYAQVAQAFGARSSAKRAQVKVKRDGVWGPATDYETFAYHDFVSRHPSTLHYYHPKQRTVPIEHG